jgi:hypothetical protein
VHPATRHDGLFSLLLLLPAVALLWVCRTVGPASFRPLFGDQPFHPVLLVAAVLAAMLVHEAGHLLASLLLGFRILGGALGPLQIQRQPGECKASWSWKTLFTASISAIPRSMNHWRPALMTVILAGPVATLLGGLLAATRRSSEVQAYFVQVSMLLFFLGLIPNGRRARRPNDARLLLDLLCRHSGAEEMELRVRLKQHALAGDRPQDYPRDLLARLSAFRGRPEGEALFANALAQWALDSDHIELAGEWDMKALAPAESCGGPIHTSVLAWSASFDILFRNDRESARTKLSQVDEDALFPSCVAYRTRAARQLAWGRLHRVSAHIIRAQYALPRGNGHYALERSLLERMHMLALTAERAQQTKFKMASA